ncbi:MAG: response regulator [SAR324 cluster bacterium]|nr:response regulator [SAR324 cluster bacterium]
MKISSYTFESSIRFRLTAAFFIVAIIAVGSALVAWFTITQSEDQFNEIIKKTLPVVSNAQELAKEVAIFTTIAQGLTSVTTEGRRVELIHDLNNRMTLFNQQLNQLEALQFELEKIAELRDKISNLAENLEKQNKLAHKFISTHNQLKLRGSELQTKHQEFIETTQPRITEGYIHFLDYGKQISAHLRQLLSRISQGGIPTDIQTMDDEIRIGLGTLINMEVGEMRANLEMVAATYLAVGLLHESANVDRPQRVQKLHQRFQEIQTTIKRISLILSSSTPANRRVLITAMPIIAFGSGPESIFNLRLQELSAQDSAFAAAKENIRLSEELTIAVNGLITKSRNLAVSASLQLTQDLSNAQLIQILAALIVVMVALLIGFVYVRQLTLRIFALRNVMEKQAVGQDVPIPSEGYDEISDMAHALQTFVEQRKKHEIELLSAKESAENATQAKSQFLANMSHEIRTPMNAVIGFTELLDNLITDEKQKGYLEAIKKGGDGLLSLINDILDLSKIEAGKIELHYHPANIYKLLREIEKIFSLKVSQKLLAFKIDIASKTPPVLLLDEGRLRQVLFNLVGNAVKFTDEGYVKLTVALKNIQQDVDKLDLVIIVSDTGIGISEENLERIFQSFEQQEGQDTRKYGGTGLGLAISKRLIEMMGGSISVKSQLHKGTSFEICLPQISISSEKIEQAMKPAPRIEFKPATILAVDDIESNRVLLVEHFINSPIELIVAKNGQEALLFAKEFQPDLILMDLKMPGMTGYEATQILKKDEQLKHIPVLALSAAHDTSNRELMEQYGFSGCLTKPISGKQLFQELSAFLEIETVAAETEPSKPNLPVSENLSPETLANLSEILKCLENELMPKWNRLRKKQPIEEAKSFGTAIQETGKRYHVALLEDFGRDLNNYIDQFNITKLRESLTQFPDLVQKLKNYSEEQPNTSATQPEPAQQICIPPQSELQQIHDLAMRGNIKALQNHIDALITKNQQFIDFAAPIQQLLKNFQIEQIQKYVHQFISLEKSNKA